MQELCDLKIHINGQYTFILNQKIILKYSGMLKRIINQEKKKTQIRNSGIEIFDFPGGANGFELISRFCYNNGRISIDPSNVSLLHCSAIFLEMTEKISPFNLIQQTEIFLDGIFYWSWTDILVCLKSCDCFFSYADSSGLLQKLIDSLLSKISQNSDFNFTSSSSSSSSSPETTPDSIITVKRSSSSRAWWFDDLTILSPKIIEKIIKAMGTFGNDNNSLIITKFLLHYLKTAVQTKGGIGSRPKWSSEYAELANTAVYGVVLMGKTTFSCRGLFWVLRVVSGLGLSRGCGIELERLIGGMLDQATLDDLLVCGNENGGVYDVNLVLRLLRVFVSGDGVPVQRMKKVGKLIDKYMGEISPDQNLKIDKFLGVAESLPDDARDCFDGVYRAIDIYLESHPKLSFEERSKLCRCLNYEKLTLEAAKDMAKNPRIPPRITVQALLSQKTNVSSNKATVGESRSPSETQMILCSGSESDNFSELSEEKEEMKLNLQRMQWRVLELEKVCREMKGQMSKMVKSKVISSPSHNKPLPKLCG